MAERSVALPQRNPEYHAPTC